MRGYRCDNCCDFHPEEVALDAGSVFGYRRSAPPETWITLGPARDHEYLHFCSPGCVAAYVERNFHGGRRLRSAG